jgi:hypothetical protein
MSSFRSRLGECIDFGNAPQRLTRDVDAERYWAELYRRYAEEQPGLFGGMVARSEAQVLRLSMLYALLDKSNVVRKEHLEAAHALWLYCEDSARIIFGNAVGDATADKLLTAIRAKPRTGRELHELLGRHCSKDRLRAALQTLVDGGFVRCRRVPSGGRPTEMWEPVTQGAGS